jgi:hypothetical protein
MSNDLFAQAGPYSHDAYEAISVGSNVQYMLKRSSIGKMRATEAVQWVQSTSAPSSVFTQSNVCVVHQLPLGVSNEICVCQRLVMVGTLQNNSATDAATLLPVQYQINRIEILAGAQLEIIYSQNLIIDRLFFSKNDEEIRSNQAGEWYNYSDSTGLTTSTTTLAASSSAQFFLEIPCFLTRAAVFLPAINQQMTINVYWNAKAVTTTSSSQTVSLTDSRLYMLGYRHEEEIRKKLLIRYAALAHYVFYNCPEYTIAGSQALSNISATYTQISSFSGKLMTDISLTILPTAAVQQDQYNFQQLLQIDERDAGRSIFTDSLYTPLYKQFEQQTFYTSAPENVNIYFLPHSVDLYNSIENCQAKGSYLYNSNISVKLLAAASATRDIIVCGHSATMFKIQNGAIVKQQL